MILVITPEAAITNETETINQMFREGLDLLHIRKPGMNREEIVDFISRIDEAFYPQLVLHSYYDLGKEYNISRFHFKETCRRENRHQPFTGESIISTSVHDITAYNTLEKDWEYTFMSPVFPSISKKGYGEASTIMQDLKKKKNPNVKLIALGGVGPDNIHEVFEAGADGAALLGAVWESDQPLNTFKKCRKNVLLS